jgi:hypothetical protein
MQVVKANSENLMVYRLNDTVVLGFPFSSSVIEDGDFFALAKEYEPENTESAVITNVCDVDEKTYATHNTTKYRNVYVYDFLVLHLQDKDMMSILNILKLFNRLFTEDYSFADQNAEHALHAMSDEDMKTLKKIVDMTCNNNLLERYRTLQKNIDLACLSFVSYTNSINHTAFNTEKKFNDSNIITVFVNVRGCYNADGYCCASHLGFDRKQYLNTIVFTNNPDFTDDLVSLLYFAKSQRNYYINKERYMYPLYSGQEEMRHLGYPVDTEIITDVPYWFNCDKDETIQDVAINPFDWMSKDSIVKMDKDDMTESVLDRWDYTEDENTPSHINKLMELYYTYDLYEVHDTEDSHWEKYVESELDLKFGCTCQTGEVFPVADNKTATIDSVDIFYAKGKVDNFDNYKIYVNSEKAI